MQEVIKVAITGPESTGKSMLAEQLAGHYGTIWVPEFARRYLGDLKGPYHEADILEIAKGQVRLEKSLEVMAKRYLFLDTELIVTKIWSEVKYHRCDPWIVEGILNQHYFLYLLCDIDLPWEFDPLREHPDMRADLFQMYHQELTLRNLPFVVVRGSGIERLRNAVNAIEQFKMKADGR